MAVYFIRAGEDGPVKIGVSEDPAGRLCEFQTAHHELLSLIRTVDGSYGQEAWLHRHYRHLHIRGEWFRFCPTMLTVEVEMGAPCSRTTAPLSPVGIAMRDRGIAKKHLAATLGIAPAAVCQWATGRTHVRPERVLAVEKATGIPRHVLRPDIYPTEGAA